MFPFRFLPDLDFWLSFPFPYSGFVIRLPGLLSVQTHGTVTLVTFLTAFTIFLSEPRFYNRGTSISPWYSVELLKVFINFLSEHVSYNRGTSVASRFSNLIDFGLRHILLSKFIPAKQGNRFYPMIFSFGNFRPFYTPPI